ncbi:M56 family metallopeptidase [Saccharothrix deserti]|uniref:M56 family metallopeptidase n=1 Tax=Saccharothrix deserti TaxID=2593674 RepID=UPI00131EB904|nr:M56 family metallopeptidase [Saccharothrix deserti]
MTVAAALLVTAGLTGLLAPRQLLRLVARGADPLVPLLAWLASTVSVVTTAALAMTLLLLPDHGSHVLAGAHECWSSLEHGMAPSVEAVGGAVGLALVVGLLVRLAVVSVRGARRRARRRRDHLAVLRVTARREPGSPPTLWLDHDEPLAFSLAGTPGVVVATEGLHRRLTREQVEAVLAHERAHLNGRHHLLVAASDALSTVLPFLPLFRRAPGVVRELVELAADAAAVRTCGVETVRAALLGVSGSGTPGSALAMGRDSVQVRLDLLARPRRRPDSARSLLAYGAACTTAMVVPSVTAFVGLLALIVVACP